MLEAIQSYLPAEWQRTVEFLGAPLWWIPPWQGMLLGGVLGGSTMAEIVAKVVFLLPPVLVVVVGVWATMGAVYTLPFRATRVRFVTTLAYMWWDVGRSIWFFWVGVIRVLVLLVGWVWGLLKLGARIVVSTLKATIESPFVVLDWTTQRYFKPGVPWIAFLLILGWSALEGTIFTYTLLPTINEVLSNLTGFEPSTAVVTPILWLFLVLLIAGSFACIEGLSRAIRSHDWSQIVTMVFVEFAVMFFEVVFLYRELVDAITPWVYQQSGIQMGLISTLVVAGLGWMGVRGMTWFLFGRWGTPALVSILSRETISQQEASMPAQLTPQVHVIGDAVATLKQEIDWFKEEGRHLMELVSLPILQLLAVALNFPIVVVRGDPMFRLPFRTLDEVVASVGLAGGERGSVTRRASA
jgi:hypothetical protein